MATKIPAANVRLNRVYEFPATDDGMPILVDRLWPRGVTKKRATIDQWLKDIAPSTELRQWFAHDPPAGKNFVVAMRGRFARTASFFGSGSLPDVAPLPWCTQLMTKSATMRSN